MKKNLYPKTNKKIKEKNTFTNKFLRKFLFIILLSNITLICVSFQKVNKDCLQLDMKVLRKTEKRKGQAS